MKNLLGHRVWGGGAADAPPAGEPMAVIRRASRKKLQAARDMRRLQRQVRPHPPPSWSFLPYFWLKTEIPALFRGRVMPNANIPEVNFSLQGTSFGNKELEYFFAIGEFP